MKNIFDLNYKIITDKLLCPNCFNELSIDLIFENSTISWPDYHWIYLQCPKCKAYSHVELFDRIIKTGLLDGAPGPVFVCCSTVCSNDLFVWTNENKLMCEYNGTEYEFPANE